jgi:hypothetical protein
MLKGADLQPTADGHRVRLRYGKGLRARFLIRTLNERSRGTALATE